MAKYTRVWQIYETLTPKPKDLLKSDRFFVREGYLHVFNEKKRKMKKRYFFLFNDILLLTKKESHKRYWLRIHITLRSPFVSVESDEYGYHEFKLHCKNRSFVFQAESKGLKDGWVRDLRAAASGSIDGEEETAQQTADSLINNEIKLAPLRKVENQEEDTPLPQLAAPPATATKKRRKKRSSRNVTRQTSSTGGNSNQGVPNNVTNISSSNSETPSHILTAPGTAPGAEFNPFAPTGSNAGTGPAPSPFNNTASYVSTAPSPFVNSPVSPFGNNVPTTPFVPNNQPAYNVTGQNPPANYGSPFGQNTGNGYNQNAGHSQTPFGNGFNQNTNNSQTPFGNGYNQNTGNGQTPFGNGFQQSSIKVQEEDPFSSLFNSSKKDFESNPTINSQSTGGSSLLFF
eukprot:TRINITY_DN9656_c0_g1_i1.p1 TRINITY_DN9656_c0_g1~~TRINITY_DN9656_c0_g1_i1.p1  ORF type:complete len:400 (-),score=93.10 TRINITY_DN9656_c0_g1_i1:62-1261(-)